MTAREMELKLIQLAAQFQQTRSEDTRAEYRALHARWLEAKRG